MTKSANNHCVRTLDHISFDGEICGLCTADGIRLLVHFPVVDKRTGCAISGYLTIMSGSHMNNESEHKSPRESGEDSEDESEILEESPCGRWLKRREEVRKALRLQPNLFRQYGNHFALALANFACPDDVLESILAPALLNPLFSITCAKLQSFQDFESIYTIL